MVTGFLSFVALFKPFPEESFFTRKRVVVVWIASFAVFALGWLLRPVPSLAPFFILVGIVAGTFSFIALFRPLPQIWLPTRKRATVVWAASFALVALGGSLISDLEEAETRLAAEAAAEAAQAETRLAEDEARLAEDARLAAAEERARLAAESFPTRREDLEQRLDELEGIINDEAWVRAKNDGEALQQELSPLFRSSIADTPEVTSIRTRLDDALGVARKEERALPRPTQASEALALMEVAFVGNPRQAEIQARLDRALNLYTTPISEENYSRAGSVLVSLRREIGPSEMDILDHMIRSHVPEVNIDFPNAASLSAAALAAGDR